MLILSGCVQHGSPRGLPRGGRPAGNGRVAARKAWAIASVDALSLGAILGRGASYAEKLGRSHLDGRGIQGIFIETLAASLPSTFLANTHPSPFSHPTPPADARGRTSPHQPLGS